MKLNLLVLTLLMTSLTTDVFPAAKGQASGSDDEQHDARQGGQSEQPEQKKARTDAAAADAPICAICRETEEEEEAGNGILMTAEQASLLLTCGHREFHQTCLTQALAAAKAAAAIPSCPLCRQPAVGAQAVGADDSEEEDAPPLTLNEAVVQNNLGAVRALLAAGADVNAADEVGNTPLHLAVARGNLRVARILIDADANIQALDVSRSTPLDIAATTGDLDIINIMLPDSPSSFRTFLQQAKNSSGEPILHWATKNNLEVLTYLLSRPGIDVNSIDAEGNTPLQLAVIQNKLDAVKALLATEEIDPNKSPNGITPLHVAVMDNAVNIVEALLKHPRIAFNHKDSEAQATAIMHAAMHNYTGLVRRLLQVKGINTEGVMDIAVSQNHREIIDLLSKHLANPAGGAAADDGAAAAAAE